MAMSLVSSSFLIVVAVSLAGCASNSGIRSGTELAGTPSSTGCDAWFEIGGTFSRLNDVRYTLRDRSTNPACLGTRVTLLFWERLPPGAVRVLAPEGWRTMDVPCQGGAGACGVEWHTGGGVRPGEDLRGFGLAYDSTRTPRQKLWIVDVGRRRVEMAIGTVGGLID
jgi:hypothetical protein